jgi:misacylated tRNA(Ala) deacylase
MTKGNIIHITDEVKGKLWAGEKVKGAIDCGRRYTLMKNHTTAHLMAEALRRATSTPLKIVGSAIDVDKARLDLAYEESLGPLLSEIEKAANSIVKENLPVEVKMMKREEAEEYVRKFHESLETLPPQVQNVRIVEIKGLHACACGGIHVKNTSEIGSVKVLKRRSKGSGVERIEFVVKSLT